MAIHPRKQKTRKDRKEEAKKVEPSPKKKSFLTPLNATVGIVLLCFAGVLLYFFLMPSGPIAASGDTVSVYYLGKLTNGSVFDTNIEAEAKAAGIFDSARAYEPMTFALGSGQVIVGFEKGIIGMRGGQKKTVTIKPEEAYGYPQESQIQNVSIPSSTDVARATLKDRGISEAIGTIVPTAYGEATLTKLNETSATFEIRPKVGETLYFQNGFSAKVLSILPLPEEGNLNLTLDANHPLAGKTLVFEITLSKLEKAAKV